MSLRPAGSVRQFASGTPCTGNPAYDVSGCFAPGSRVGAYSTGEAHFGIEYFGDGNLDAGVAGGRTREMQPNSYLLETQMLVFAARGNFFHMGFGYRSLDVERQRIWSGYGPWNEPALLQSTEWYAGVPPGVVRSSGTLTERASLEHDGPVRWFGAGAMGGTGGCVLLTTDGGTLAGGYAADRVAGSSTSGVPVARRVGYSSRGSMPWARSSLGR